MEINAKELHTENEAALRLMRLLARDDVFARLLLEADAACEAIPEARAMIGFDQCNPHHPYDAWTHTAHCVAYAEPIPILRLTMLMHDLGKPETFYLTEDAVGHFNRHEKKGEEIARKRLPELGFDAETTETAAILVRLHDKGIAETDLRALADEIGQERLWLLFAVKEADARAHDPKYKSAQLAKLEILRRAAREKLGINV